MQTNAFFASLVIAACVAGAGCGGGTTAGDAGFDAGGGHDAGPITTDSGPTTNDTGPTTSDSGPTTHDAGPATADAGNDAATSADAGSCPTPPSDLSAIDQNCAGGVACPSGYTCQSMSGVVLQQRCEILCTPGGCPCPATTACMPHTDKSSTWHQCDPA